MFNTIQERYFVSSPVFNKNIKAFRQEFVIAKYTSVQIRAAYA